MTSRDFAYWLMGFFEIADPKTITEEQTQMIKNHLNLVFYHEIDPSYTDDKERIKKMNEIHEGKATLNPNKKMSEEDYRKIKEDWEKAMKGTEHQFINPTPSGGIFPSEKDTVLRC